MLRRLTRKPSSYLSQCYQGYEERKEQKQGLEPCQVLYLQTKNVTTLASILTSQKTSSSLGNLYIDDRQENRGRRIRTDTLYLVFRHFQGLNQGHT